LLQPLERGLLSATLFELSERSIGVGEVSVDLERSVQLFRRS
jgi:hypothetical protein